MLWGLLPGQLGMELYAMHLLLTLLTPLCVISVPLAILMSVVKRVQIIPRFWQDFLVVILSTLSRGSGFLSTRFVSPSEFFQIYWWLLNILPFSHNRYLFKINYFYSTQLIQVGNELWDNCQCNFGFFGEQLACWPLTLFYFYPVGNWEVLCVCNKVCGNHSWLDKAIPM